ncbi:nucleoporin nup44 [Lichtheimia corymbifera JMRC:FSU:9682]|uniref:Nucleoporin nup44 n=1 Tax=Lichtheimia corymbifera JMRC:FSU:9682 TaxID=1263082 RepID=A0A068RJ52_9FUNG|nr:nucleoporin nup44 [Lichtheimia corymbifera JMRC:FSU:9682]
MAFTFGSSSSQPSTGFGANAGQATTGFGTTPATTNTAAGTLFGAGTTNSTSAGTLFGANTGNAATSTTPFGTTNNTTNAAGTLFGGTATSAAPGSTFGFGNTNTSTVATSSAQAPGSSSFGFGGTNPSTPFGQKQNTGFGASTGNTGFGLGSTGFGAQNTTTSTTTGFNLGSANTTSIFGQQKPQAGTGFGATSFLGPQQQQQQLQQQQQGQQQQQQQQNVWQQLALIRAHWDPSSHLCQFRHYFYNVVPANERHRYTRPADQDEHLWNEAMQNNPDPTTMVPVLATGFGDVLKRMEMQDIQLDAHKKTMMEIGERLETVQQKYMLGSLVKLDEQRRRHTDLTQRLIRMLKYVQVLRYKGFPLHDDEHRLMEVLKQMTEQALTPEQLNNRLRESWATLQAIKRKRQSGNQDGYEAWRATSKEDMARIAELLSHEQEGMRHVSNTLQKDLESIQTIEENLKSQMKRDKKSNILVAS